MFKNLRLNLTGKFLILSVSAYLIVSCISVYLFELGLTQSMDRQLQEIYAVVFPEIEIAKDGSLSLRDAPRQLHVSNLLLSPTVTLFDSKEQMLAQHGPAGSKELFPSGIKEVNFDRLRLRTLSKPISNEKNLGYIQIQLSTSTREHAISQFLQALAWSFPLLLLSFGAAGYLFASRALEPVENTISILRRFMSDAGHELKTPIAVIHATCDNLAADLEGNKAACDRVDVISRTADRMQRLVADLLLLTKSEQSKLILKMLPLRFDMLLREVLGEFSDLFEEKGIELVANTIHATRVSGDKDALHRMLTNLIENAFKYTEAGGRVEVELVLIGPTLSLIVSDTGLGIPEKDMDKIFERFYRVDESRSRKQGGSGLGLAIVKAIVESHNGEISLESTVGKGTKFTVILPTVGQSSMFVRRIELDENSPA